MCAMAGDASLFMREDEIEQAWSIIDPLTRAQEDATAPPPAPYPRGSWGPPEAEKLLLRDGRSWVLETVTEKSAAQREVSEEQANHQVRRRRNRG